MFDWDPAISFQTHTKNLMSGFKFCTFPSKSEVPDDCCPLSCPIPTKDMHGKSFLYPWVSSSGNRLSCTRLEGHCHASFLPSVHFPLPKLPSQHLLACPFLPPQLCDRRCSRARPSLSLAGSQRHQSFRTLHLNIKQCLPFALHEPADSQFMCLLA